MENYHSQSIAQILKNLKCSKEGLSTAEALKRSSLGSNSLPSSGAKFGKLKIFLEQWTNPLILILVFAGVVSGFLREFIDMTVIFITVFLNVLIGFVQEYKANEALKKLNDMVSYHALVLRDGKKVQIDSSQVVPGDVLILEAGDKVQADARIFEAVNFEVNESLLTGESESVKKHTRVLAQNTTTADRKNMAHKGTVIVNGRAQALVVAIGKNTQVGQIATLVKETEHDKTPLQKQLSQVSKGIGIVVLCISLLIFVLGYILKNEYHSFFEIFETSVAVAVAAIPEGLVISLTVILAIGMQYILKKNALVRKLVSAETLGSVSVICTDKTGTLTEGKMKLTHAVTAQNEYDLDEISRMSISQKDAYRDVYTMLQIGILCNDGVLENPHEDESKWKMAGDTTDTALIIGAMHAGLRKDYLETVFTRVGDLPFDSVNKFMATVHAIDHTHILYVKGAPEMLFDRCSHYEENGTVKKMTREMKEWFQKQQYILAGKGLRVLACAYKNVDTDISSVSTTDVEGLTFVGLLALSDPLRSDVRETIEIAKKAGIRIIMITGDHAQTARSIGVELGIPSEPQHIFNGEQLEHISDIDLQNALRDVSIFARVDPKHKIRIVQALQAQGEVVAMTGDGVNDAPALKGADIGIALGSGTDVAKEISDVVLLDDRFSTIVSAVEQGRGIYQNIKKVMLYLLSGSFGEVVLVVGSLVAGMPLAIVPVQILWVNLIEDSLPNMALAFDTGDVENMQEFPRKKSDPIIDKEMWAMIAIISIISNLVLFGLFVYFWKHTGNIVLTRTIMFVGLGIDSLCYIFSVRSFRRHVWHMNPFDNHYLNWAVIIGWIMLISAVYLAPLQLLLRTVSLGWEYWLVMFLFALLNVVLIELVKGVFLFKKKYV
ncbi:MAG: HAD-IC family P-type ATPase [Candidatus Magasanikbacteria bacterium]|nr:HAD-IC family P-type ATPase [Candidatus Magasanikbacteria bacterium]